MPLTADYDKGPQKTMKKLKVWALLTLTLAIFSIKKMDAHQYNIQLSAKEQGIVSIAIFTANGDQPKLKAALHSALDAGLTVNEIKEELIQLYAYCGFPRSLNGITVFMTVLDERKAGGKHDEEGPAPVSVTGTNDSKYQLGKSTLEVLTGRPQSGSLTGANAFAPGIDAFLKEHLFADIFGRGVLTYQQRELATISALATLPGLGAQLQAHIGIGMNVGLTETQLRSAFAVLEKNADQASASAANAILDGMLNSKQ